MIKFKKTISVLLCAAMSLSLFTASISAEETAAEPVSVREGVIEALHLIEPVKENYGFTDEDLENMEFANPISTYEYTSEGVSFLRRYIPLLCDNALVAWAIEDVTGEEVIYQISTTYIDEINKIICYKEPFALIYDVNCCYLFNGVSLQELGSYEDTVGRLALTEDVLNNSSVELNAVHKTHNLEYTEANVTYGAVLPETTYKCNVTNVSQNNIMGVCWAATTACIVNYIKGTNYTYMGILKECIDISTDNYKMAKEDIPKVFQRFGLSYQYKDYVPNMANIEKNIKNDYPIYASFYYGNGLYDAEGSHSGTIYGCTIVSTDSSLNCIYIMDPQNGAFTAQAKNSTYTYIDSRTGYVVWLIAVSSRY